MAAYGLGIDGLAPVKLEGGGGEPAADADHQAPGQHEMPGLRDLRAKYDAAGKQAEAEEYGAPNAEAQHCRTRERAHQAEQKQIERDRR